MEQARSLMGSKAVSEIRRFYSASVGRKGTAMNKIVIHWGLEAGLYLSADLSFTKMLTSTPQSLLISSVYISPYPFIGIW